MYTKSDTSRNNKTNNRDRDIGRISKRKNGSVRGRKKKRVIRNIFLAINISIIQIGIGGTYIWQSAVEWSRVSDELRKQNKSKRSIEPSIDSSKLEDLNLDSQVNLRLFNT